jgi:hypothetical protein
MLILIILHIHTLAHHLCFCLCLLCIPLPFNSLLCYAYQQIVLSEWGTYLNAASTPPLSPTKSSQPIEDVILIPFGSSMLRLAEIPTLLDTLVNDPHPHNNDDIHSYQS